MAINEVTAYELLCDRCSEQFEYGDYTIFTDRSDLPRFADEEDWREIDGQWLCQECWLYSGEETEDGVLVAVAKPAEPASGEGT